MNNNERIDQIVSLKVKGYTDEEITFIEAHAKGQNISLVEAASDDIIAGAIEEVRRRQ